MMLSFVLIMILLSWIDIKTKVVPNILVMPLIFLGCYLTGNWAWALIIFCFGYVIYEKLILGGDVKLMTMVAAFLGCSVVTAVFFSFSFLLLYRFLSRDSEGLAYTPFLFLGSMISLFIM